MFIKRKRPWQIPESLATPEGIYMNRRQFMKSAGLLGALPLFAGFYGIFDITGKGKKGGPLAETPKTPTSYLYPAKRSAVFTLDRPLTDEAIAATYNNYYEFSAQKNNVWKKVERFPTRPWTVDVTGLVEKPKVYDIDALVKEMPLEERLYRFRCVEAWAMAVPWTGFTLSALIKKVKPLSSARYIRFQTFLNKDWAPRQESQFYDPWPYEEGLTMEEAANELTIMATGIYGHELPKQHGAPIRLVTPWKYGFKSIKSVVKIEFTDKQPKTFWNILVPDEYDFWANVNPEVPHPRWSQAKERMIDTDETRATMKYNGYGEYVAGIYEKR